MLRFGPFASQPESFFWSSLSFSPFFFGTATFPSWLQGLITLFSLDGDEDGVEDGDREPCVAMAQQLGHERIEIWLSVWY